MPVARDRRSLTQRNHLSVRGGVVVLLALVTTPADDGAVRIKHNRTDGHVARVQSLAGLVERGAHSRAIADRDRGHGPPFR